MEGEEKEHHQKNQIHNPNLRLNSKYVGLEKIGVDQPMGSQVLQPQPM